MNHQHLIDSAIFESTIAAGTAAVGRKAEIEAFIRKDLMQVVDEVFDQVDGKLVNSGRVLRIGRLELDLGEIPYPEFRHQMPRKLREQLLLALGDMPHPLGHDARLEPGPVDRESAAQEQLFYFLRHGYLPWYSRLEGAEALDALLIEAIDSAPARLVELLLDNEQRAVVIERLQRQFSMPIVERVMRLLPSSETEVDTHAAQSGAMQAQLVAALLSGNEALVRASWQALHDSHIELLEKTVRLYGQKAIVRHRIVAGLSTAQFDDLLRLLEPAAHGQVKAILDIDEMFQSLGGSIPADRLKLEAELREYALGFLLVEGGSRFDELSFVRSLFRQTVASSNRGQSGELVATRTFAQKMPVLFLCLNRELQNGNQVWEQAIKGLPVAVLTALVDIFLSKGSTSGTSEPSAGMSELALAIQNNAVKSKNRQLFYARVLDRLVRDELIDFDAIVTAESGATTTVAGDLALDDTVPDQDLPASSKFAPRELLLSAELLTRASYGTGISLTATQLDRLKRQIIEDYLAETGDLFNASYFSLQFVETLIRQANIADTKQFRELLKDNLLQISPPSTHEMTRRLVDLLADESEVIPVPDASAARPTGEPGDEATPLESIYIANAGAVLFAPYLPRLFERLSLTEEGRFKDRNAAERGVHCVQFLVNESTSSPEYQLVLNKLLCGIRPGRPIRRSIELGADEKEQLESLLRAIIENWKVIGNTSVAGLRESFLQRNGRLQLENDAWHLSVEARPFDMLLDQLPWSFSTIKLPWMERIIYVEWR